MVKTQFGRKPGKKHAKIVKQLRHRRRLLAAAAARQQRTEMVDTFSCETLQRTPELPFNRIYVTLSEADCSFDDGESVAAAADASTDGNDMQLVAVKAEDMQLVLFKDAAKALHRSETCIFCVPVSVDRPTVSESWLPPQSAIPLAAPLPVIQEMDETNRPQHSDEETDRYLSMLFTPSAQNITTDEHTQNDPTQNDTRSEDFTKLRNLFSSDTQHSKSAGLSSEYMDLNSLFHTTSAGTVTSCETSMGLNTLFNNRTARNASSCETSMGLSTLFNEKSEKDEKFKPGLPTIISETSMGLNTLFNNKTATDPTLTIREMPSMTNFSSSSLLGNLFGSEHAIRDEGDEAVSAKERKKVLIAKDLANYLNSDDERTQPKSKSLSTFVQQIETLFDKYRAAIAELEILKNEIAELKAHHQQE